VPLIHQAWITRADLWDNRDRRYVFGDNVQRSGFAGQAKEMRGEPNAIGVVTKWAPSMSPRAFFDDTQQCKDLVINDLMTVQYLLDCDRSVVVPADGIGTGLSRLPQYAPNLDRFIKEWFRSRS
jgi:hypothetical protein